MKLLYMTLLIFLVLQSSNAQKREVYKFVLENKVIDSISEFYIGASPEQSYTRIVHKDSIIEEVGLFKNGNSVFFKIKKNNWYVKNGKKWDLFYSPKAKISPKIKFGNLFYTMTYKEKTKVGQLDCVIYVYEFLKSDNTITLKDGTQIINVLGHSNHAIYCFSPKYGIIKEYLRDNVTLVREDILFMQNN